MDPMGKIIVWIKHDQERNWGNHIPVHLEGPNRIRSFSRPCDWRKPWTFAILPGNPDETIGHMNTHEHSCTGIVGWASTYSYYSCQCRWILRRFCGCSLARSCWKMVVGEARLSCHGHKRLDDRPSLSHPEIRSGKCIVAPPKKFLFPLHDALSVSIIIVNYDI